MARIVPPPITPPPIERAAVAAPPEAADNTITSSEDIGPETTRSSYPTHLPIAVRHSPNPVAILSVPPGPLASSDGGRDLGPKNQAVPARRRTVLLTKRNAAAVIIGLLLLLPMIVAHVVDMMQVALAPPCTSGPKTLCFATGDAGTPFRTFAHASRAGFLVVQSLFLVALLIFAAAITGILPRRRKLAAFGSLSLLLILMLA